MKLFMRKTALLVTLAALLFGATSCSKKRPTGSSNVDYWTCTMHPSVHSKTPGKCPICSMDLVPVMKKGEKNETEKGRNGAPATSPIRPFADSSTHEFVVPVERQQQIGITYAKVE